MYDLPAKFNWGLLKRAVELGVNASEPFSVNGPPFPDYQGGLSHQHSPEYWLTIDLLTDPAAKEAGSSVVRRVTNPSEADVFFVPYWASLAYNVYIPTRGEYAQELELQQELVDWLLSQELWKRSGGRDHLLVLHHPNAMAALRSRLSAAMWVLADFARYPPEEANLAKDVIAPYAHMAPRYEDDVDEERAWGARTTLLFFQGSLYRKRDGLVRELLLNVLKNEPDVIVREGSTDADGVREASEGMRSARFCLHPAGDTPSSNRLFDAIFSHCVPVIVSDAIELPFEGDLDYRGFAIFVASRNAVTPGVLTEFLRSIPRRMWARMWARLHEVAPFFEYDNPASPAGAVNRIWKEVALRLPSRRLEIHRALRRVHQTDLEGLRMMERRLQRMDPSFVKIQRKRLPAESPSGT